jgi:hypothetical protein
MRFCEMHIARFRRLPAEGTSLAFVLGIGVAMAPLFAQAEKKEKQHGATHDEESVCDEAGLRGAAWGLCHAYCEAMDCDSEDPRASEAACERVWENWEKHGDGGIIPCEEIQCPCWSSAEDLLSVHASAVQALDSPPIRHLDIRVRACLEDPDTLAVGVGELISGASITSRVSPIDASCATEMRPRGGAVLPVLRTNELRDDEILECSDIVLEACLYHRTPPLPPPNNLVDPALAEPDRL